jgi:hypothetical protein
MRRFKAGSRHARPAIPHMPEGGCMNGRCAHTNRLITLVMLLFCLGSTAALAGPPAPATEQDVQRMIKAAGDADAYPGASVVYVLDEADVHVKPTGLATTESRQIIKILTDAGVKAHAVLRHNFDPDTNRVAIRSVRIHRAAGGIDEVPLDGIVIQPTEQYAIYWGGEQYLLSLPRLHIGDCLDITLSKIGFNIAYLDGFTPITYGDMPMDASSLQPPMAGHWYEVTLFQGAHPIINKRYAVHIPSSMPMQYGVYNGPVQSSKWTDGEIDIYTFTGRDIPPVKSEHHKAANDDVVPKVVMATVPDWETKSRWFHEVNEGQFEADDAIRAKVAEITEGLDRRRGEDRSLPALGGGQHPLLRHQPRVRARASPSTPASRPSATRAASARTSRACSSPCSACWATRRIPRSPWPARGSRRSPPTSSTTPSP